MRLSHTNGVTRTLLQSSLRRKDHVYHRKLIYHVAPLLQIWQGPGLTGGRYLYQPKGLC
jgi:hypothetical protein